MWEDIKIGKRYYIGLNILMEIIILFFALSLLFWFIKEP